MKSHILPSIILASSMLLVGCNPKDEYYGKAIKPDMESVIGKTPLEVQATPVAPSMPSTRTESQPSPVVSPNEEVTIEQVSKVQSASELFKQTEDRENNLDILWVIDNSGSMADEQESVAKNFDAFISNFIKKNVDFRMAITTTDSRELWKGLVRKGSMETLTSAKAKEDQEIFINNFKELIKVGTQGNGVEIGMASITNFVEVHGANFLRDDAYFVVILVTDEDDQSPLNASDYANELKKAKSDAGKIKVFSIVDMKSKPKTGGSLVKGHERYKEFSKLTNGYIHDINQDFAKSLKSIGDSVSQLVNNFKLAHTPVPGTLRVYVNNELIAAGKTTFVENDNLIVFKKGSEPKSGSSIRVDYDYILEN